MRRLVDDVFETEKWNNAHRNRGEPTQGQTIEDAGNMPRATR